MSNIFKAMKAKKKRAVDPNAPPRPNLMTHDVKIRDQQTTINALMHEVDFLKEKVRVLNNKVANQTAYLQELHNRVLRNK